MTVFEILKINGELIKRLGRIGFKPDDCRYIDLYDEYERMKKSGDKVTYIVMHLSAKYGVCERKVYGIIKRFSRTARWMQCDVWMIFLCCFQGS